ncbi:hypothetical protein AB1Y20_001460 [Prymnesium parvum]|uniref:Uncharacterized protein n=1 Tax=Prymnesium parvum TaxID=97485 RepID=A0AB34KDE9_PRYPA
MAAPSSPLAPLRHARSSTRLPHGELRRPCSPQDVADALSHLIACGATARFPPTCSRATAWPALTLSDGSGLAAHPDERRRRCARAAFDAFLCALRPAADAEALRPPDWAFGANPPSVGKFLARWAMSLYLRSLVGTPSRHTLRPAEVGGWRWLPAPRCGEGGGAARGGWFEADVCARVPLPPSGAEGLREAHRGRAWRALVAIARGNQSGGWRRGEDPLWVATAGGSQTTAGLWWAGQMMRRVRASLGRCAHAASRPWLRGRMVHTGGGWRAEGEGAARERAHAFTLAVHVRRGDACVRWARRGDSTLDRGRPCYAAGEYMAVVRALLAKARQGEGKLARLAAGRVRLLIASDSESVADEMAALAASDGIELVQLRGDRGAGWGGAREGANIGKNMTAAAAEFIEARNERGLVDRVAVLGSFLADLTLLGQAHAFVGTAASWTSRVILLSIIGERGVVPPFAFVDKPLGRLWFA